MSGEAAPGPAGSLPTSCAAQTLPSPQHCPTQPAPSTLMSCSQRLDLPNLSLLVCRMGPLGVAVRTRGQGAGEGPVPGRRPLASSCVGSHKGALWGPSRALTPCRDPTASHPALGVRISAYARGRGGHSEEQLGTVRVLEIHTHSATVPESVGRNTVGVQLRGKPPPPWPFWDVPTGLPQVRERRLTTACCLFSWGPRDESVSAFANS